MESDCDIIQQVCMSNDQDQMAIALKDATMSDFMDAVSSTDNSSHSNMKTNEATMSDGTIYRSHFVEIGEFSCGSIFGLGEHMDDRAIVAKHTQVQCLLIPRYWLFEKEQNAGNIWQRYVFFYVSLSLSLYRRV